MEEKDQGREDRASPEVGLADVATAPPNLVFAEKVLSRLMVTRSRVGLPSDPVVDTATTVNRVHAGQ